MRINNEGPQEKGAVYNDLFNHFPHELMVACIARAPATKDTYVEVPEAQKSILAFTRSGSPDVGLFCGSKGIGKTSVLSYLVREIWPAEGCSCLSVNLLDWPNSSDLGDDYYSVDISIRRHRCDAVAAKVLKRAVIAHIDGLFPTVDDFPVGPCAALLKIVCPSLVPVTARFSAVDDSAILTSAASTSSEEFHAFLLYFALWHQKRVHAKLVVDNLDDQDSLFVLVLADKLAKLRVFFDKCSGLERKAISTAPQRALTTLISCRATTFTHIRAVQKSLNGMDWFSFYQIHINAASRLGPILKRRYDAEIAGKELFDGDATKIAFLFGSSEHSTTIANRDAFFRRLIAAFSSTTQPELLLMLCNNDLSDTLEATLDVLRNRHFMRNDVLFKVTHVGDKERTEVATDAFTTTTALRCLAYGNQNGAHPMYPIKDTQVPNILLSSVLPESGKTSLVKARIVGWFATRQSQSHNSQFSRTREYVESLINRLFGLRREIVVKIIDEMHAEKLLEHSQGSGIPSDHGSGCLISITPRAICLWRQLLENSVLLQCHREVVELDPDITMQSMTHEWTYVRAYSTQMKNVLSDLPWLCVQFWKVEKEHFLGMSDTTTKEYFEEFGRDFVTERAVHGITNSWRFWSHEVKDQGILQHTRDLCNQILVDCQIEKRTRFANLPTDE